jgi:hypothetical protein
MTTPRYPIMMPKQPDGSGMMMQKIDDGNLVPIFMQGFSPKQFFMSSGITTQCEMSSFPTRAHFIAFLEVVVASPQKFQVSGFVPNPTSSDLASFPSISPADLLAQCQSQK